MLTQSKVRELLVSVPVDCPSMTAYVGIPALGDALQVVRDQGAEPDLISMSP